ncbi:hypothetical protein EHS39_13490 [Ensifer sp. MPMI2T]|nr:hypothetical protein EHS39_13490 [Ensifer sp. MPMI2T]
MKRTIAVAIMGTLITVSQANAEAATFMFCRYPDPKHVTGFRSESWLIDGDALRQAGGKYRKTSLAATKTILVRTNERMEAQWSNRPDLQPRFVVNLKTGQASQPVLADPSKIQYGTCVLREHELDGSTIGE